jgi:thiaminase
MDVFDRLRAAAASDWALYVEHEFVRQLQARRLPEAAFRAYLVQDYLFLIQFARAYALAVYKGSQPSRYASCTSRAFRDPRRGDGSPCSA